ncbi:MAG: DUF4082 domain-containing protein, partial [Verrucomicrobiota bacterium]
MKKRFPKFIALLACLGLVNASAATKLVTGFVKREVFLNIPGATVAELTASQKFIDNQPDGVSLLGSFEAPGSSGDNYGQRLSGLLVPPATGSYVFFIASDDESELWLSPDDKPAGKQLVASVQNFTDSREWNKYPDTQNNALAPLSLQAGQPYYIEALMKEGSSGDNLAVGWVLPGQYVDPANPPDGLTNITVIAGSFLGAIVELTNSRVAITSPPTNLTSFTASRALFSIKADGASDLGNQVLYQWRRNGTDIAGSTAAAYLTPELTLADNGARYSCVVSGPGMAVTSTEATLTVLDSQTPRLQIAAAAPPARNVALSWQTSDPGFALQARDILGGTASWTVPSEQPSYEGATAKVTLEANDPSRFFRLKHETVVLESLFPASATPASDLTSPGYELGTVFSAKTPGLIRAIRLYSLPGEFGNHAARIWRNRDNTVVTGPYDIPCLGVEGWVDFDLPKALAVEPDVDYTVSVTTAQDAGKVYPVSANFVPAAGGNDRSLTFPAAAGVFGTQLGARPAQTTQNSFYFRDVVFAAGETPPENLIIWPLDVPVRLGRGGDGNDRELGTVFRSSLAGTITAIRVLATKLEGGDHTATIWRNFDESIIAGPYTLQLGCNGALCGDEWVVYALETPAEIQANTDYTVSVSTGADVSRAYPILNQAFGVAGGNGKHLTYPADAGVFGNLGVRPTQTDAANPSYLRDVVFQPTESIEGESLADGGAVYPGKLSVPNELGTVFQSSVAGSITGIRVYSLSVESGIHKARIWRNSDNTLIGGPYDLTYGGTTGWRTFALPAALTIDPNILYTVTVSTGDDVGKAYPLVPDGFISADSNTKHLSYPAMAGVLTTALGTRPTQAPNGNSYLRDIVFQPAVEGARATIGNTTDGPGRDVITNPGDNGSGAYINGNQFQATADVTLTKIKVSLDNATGEFKCAIYSDQDGLGDRLLAQTQPKSNPTTGWNEFSLLAPLHVKAGDKIWLVVWSNDPQATVHFVPVTGQSPLHWSHVPYAADWPDPIVMETGGGGAVYS